MEMTSLGNDLSQQSTSHCTLLHCLESVSGNLELLTPYDYPSLNKGECRHASISGKNRKKNLNQQHFLP